MPVGTAKCYAHRARASMRELLADGRPRRDPAAPFGKEEIERILPHRDPFLLLDEVIELEPGRKVVATRLVRAEDWWFPGHFPERPVMPGVLIVEAMAQAGAVAVLVEEENRGKIAFFAGIDDCRFKRVVSPGRDPDADLRDRRDARPDRAREGDCDGRRKARRPRNADVRGGAMIASATGPAIGITGLGDERARHRDDERRHGPLRRYLRRVDPRAHRDSRAADRDPGRGADGHRAAGGAGGARRGRRRSGRDRPRDLRHRHARTCCSRRRRR